MLGCSACTQCSQLPLAPSTLHRPLLLSLSGLAFYLIKSACPSYQMFFDGILKHIQSSNAITGAERRAL